MGRTLYLGSLKSDVYFCIYEKDYEQYVKLDVYKRQGWQQDGNGI